MSRIYNIAVMSAIILMVSQIFMIVLTSSSFERVYVASTLAGYAVPQKDFVRKIESALRLGKPLEHLLGMDRLIEEYAGKYNDLANIMVVSPTWQHLYHWVSPDPDILSDAQEDQYRIQQPDENIEFLETATAYLIRLPLPIPQPFQRGIVEPAHQLHAQAIFQFHKHHIRRNINAFWKQRMLLGVGIAAGGSLLLFRLLMALMRSGGPVKIRRPIFRRVLGVTLLAQVAFGGANLILFHQDHVQVVQNKVEAQLDLVRQEIEQVLARGISLDRISRMDEYLHDILKASPEVAFLSIRDGSDNLYALAHRQTDTPEAVTTSREWAVRDRFSIMMPLQASGEPSPVAQLQAVGLLQANLNQSVLRSMLWKILLDSLTVILITSLFIIEQIVFLVSRIGTKQVSRPTATQISKDAPGRHVLKELMLARFGVFLFMIAFALPISFIPLQMKVLSANHWPDPSGWILSLPISLEMLCALLTSLLAGALADRYDWRLPFQIGILVTALGMFFCFQAIHPIAFILARGVCGLGYGLTWMALQSYLFSHATPDTRARGTSHFVAGIFSGSICGTALGAMLAERFDFATVFLVGSLLVLNTIFFFLIFMRSSTGSSVLKAPPTIFSGRSLWRYLLNRNAFALMWCCVIPFSICQVGLLFFATPLYLNQLGVNQSDIGRVLMIYGISVVYLAPQISRFVDRRNNKKPFIAVGGLLGGLGLVLLYFFHGFPAIVLAVFLLGLASSIGSSAQTAFALKLKVTQELGTGTAMAIQRAADKLGQMLGPLMLGAMISIVSFSHGLVVLGLGYMILSGLFLLLARE